MSTHVRLAVARDVHEKQWHASAWAFCASDGWDAGRESTVVIGGAEVDGPIGP